MADLTKEVGVLTAGTKEHFNSLSIGYMASGVLWRKKVFFAYVKPERYTWQFIENSDYFTISFFPKERNDVHKVFGRMSGRDVDKVKLAQVTPEFYENGVAYKEAKEVYICKKIYFKQFDINDLAFDVKERYNDPNDGVYGKTHYEIIGEIIDHLER